MSKINRLAEGIVTQDSWGLWGDLSEGVDVSFLNRSLSPSKGLYEKDVGFVLESGGKDGVDSGITSAGRFQHLTLK
jgi:hypothetical protein